MRLHFFNSPVIANSKMDYCLTFIVTGLVENHPWVMVTTCIRILTISSIIIVVYLVNNSSL